MTTSTTQVPSPAVSRLLRRRLVGAGSVEGHGARVHDEPGARPASVVLGRPGGPLVRAEARAQNRWFRALAYDDGVSCDVVLWRFADRGRARAMYDAADGPMEAGLAPTRLTFDGVGEHRGWQYSMPWPVQAEVRSALMVRGRDVALVACRGRYVAARTAQVVAAESTALG